ncbi:tail fiber protein [Pseudomonas aeruginosa]|nr:tail fiber protein [Pseudomonas aeruginosa]
MAWYSTGTVAVTLNSPTVTGTGTTFSANVRVGDAFRGPDGRWYEVTNVASSTVISIKPNYQGSTSSGQSYAVAPILGYDKDLSDRFNLIANQWGATLAGIKPWALSANAAAARGDLGLGSAAVREALGGSGALYSRDSILGAVSQASGIPSGAIIERGANANGDYVRYADGTQMCWFNASVTDQAIDVPYGSLFTGTRSWSFPIAFSGSPTVNPGLFRWGTGAGWGTVGGIASATAATLRGFDIVSRAAGTATVISASAMGGGSDELLACSFAAVWSRRIWRLHHRLGFRRRAYRRGS